MYTTSRLMMGLSLAVLAASLHAQESSQRGVGTAKGMAVEEVTVTGTHIRGSAAVGSPLIVITSEELEKSGYGRVQDYMATLPQNFDGSTSEGFGSANVDFGAANFTRGKGLDLRGLGASSTLILINGRRQPAGGLEASFVDVSSIPVSAIERIEILTDGASALYGSDAIGGVVNYVLRKDYEGLEFNARVASTDDFADEVQLAALGGHSWQTANLLFGYQYSRRDFLMAADRHYASMNQDYRSLGGSDFRTINGDPGTIRRSGQPTYAIPRGQNGTNLTVGQLLAGQVNYNDQVTGYSAQPEQEQHDALLRFSWRPMSGTELYAQARYGRRDMEFRRAGVSAIVAVPATNPFYVNPYGSGSVQVAYDFSKIVGPQNELAQVDTYALSLGADVSMPHGWALKLATDYGREKSGLLQLNAIDSTRRTACLSGAATPAQCPGTPLNVFGDGTSAVNDPATIDFIRNTVYIEGISEVKSASVIVDGGLFSLPAGWVKLAIGADYRDESLDSGGYRFIPGTSTKIPRNPAVGDLARHVSAAFAEVVVPIFGDHAAGGPHLELSLAGRYEDYSDFGSTFDPKIGINFAPMENFQLRASWGTSFRAPRFNERSQTANPGRSNAFLVEDPRSPSGESLALFMTGTDPDIDPETAKIWSAGFDFEPSALAGLRTSATYFRIDYKDKIAVGGDFGDTLLLESDWAAIITRDPSPAQVQAICDRPDFVDVGFGECPFSEAPSAIIDARLRNLSQLNVRGLDLDVSYRKDALAGQLSFGIAGTYLLEYERAASAGAAPVSVVDTVGYPAALRLRGSAGWSREGWSASTRVNYVGAYDNRAGNSEVGAWTTVDLSLSYHFTNAGWLDDTALQLAATNAFDRKPPFVNVMLGFDPANARETGRSVSLSATKRW